MTISLSIIKIYRILGTYYKALQSKMLSFQRSILSDDHKVCDKKTEWAKGL